jgi:hypothetical protein
MSYITRLFASKPTPTQKDPTQKDPTQKDKSEALQKLLTKIDELTGKDGIGDKSIVKYSKKNSDITMEKYKKKFHIRDIYTLIKAILRSSDLNDKKNEQIDKFLEGKKIKLVDVTPEKEKDENNHQKLYKLIFFCFIPIF